MKKLILALPVAMALAFPAAASAQQQEGLVNVTVNNEDLLNELQLTAPVTVEVPVGIAANVCDIDANVLAQQKQDDEDVTCEAQNSTEAFANLVSRQQN